MSTPQLAKLSTLAAPTPAELLYIPPTRQRPAVHDRLAHAGLPVALAVDVTDALRLLGERDFLLCLIDLADDRSALTTVRLIKGQYPSAHLVGIHDPECAMNPSEAVTAGVQDVLPWPFDERDLILLMANARDRESVEPARGVARSAPPTALFVQSPAMRAVMEHVRVASIGRHHLSVSGERSSGRTLVARAIHALGGGRDDQFVTIDCAAGTPEELEHALFGNGPERRDGIGTLPPAERLGPDAAVLRASGGTLFLANIAEAPSRVQARLARVLRDREGALPDHRAAVALDLRVVATLEVSPEAAVTDGRLRRDLADRLGQVHIEMPPLRRRREDIPLLAVYLVRRLCDDLDLPQRTFSRSALALLTALPWQGNARELNTLLEAIVRDVSRTVIEIDDVLEHAGLDNMASRIDPGVTLRDAKARFERDCITAVLVRYQGRVGEAARALGIQRTNLYRKVRQLNVERSLLGARK